MNEIVLIRVNGEDRPGITAALSGILAEHKIKVLDTGQSVIHSHLSWGMMVFVPDTVSESVFKDLLFKAHELDLRIHFTPITPEDYEKWVGAQGYQRHTITMVGREITAQHFHSISELLAAGNLNIDRITRLSGRHSLVAEAENGYAAIEFSVRGDVTDLKTMHALILQRCHNMNVDIAIQEDTVYRRSRRLVCFDMDSTLIQNEVIDEMAKAAGVSKEVVRITESAMRGEIGFKESFKSRMQLLKGLSVDKLPQIAESLTITPGAERLIRTLQKYGYKVAIISGGFTYFACRLQQLWGVDHVYANELEIENGVLTGNVIGEIVDEQRKASLVKQLARKEGIRLEQVIAVGDGANDIPMLCSAGLGIAFHAKPKVTVNTNYAIDHLGLDAILYLLGMRQRDFV